MEFPKHLEPLCMLVPPKAAREICGVTDTNLQNWLRLGIYTGGEVIQRDPKIKGRRFYNAFELVQLAVIKRLDGLIQIQMAAEIAKSSAVLTRIFQIGLPPVDPEDGVVIAQPRPKPKGTDQRFAVAMFDINDVLNVVAVKGTELHKFIECVVVPIDQIIIKTIDDYFQWLLDGERTDD